MTRTKKGFAPFLLLVLALGAVGTGLIVSSVLPADAEDLVANHSNLTGNPAELVDIGSESVTTIPWYDVWDYVYSGTTGLIRWSSAGIQALATWGASAAAGHPVALPSFLGLVIVIMIALMWFYKNWNNLWSFVLGKLILAGIIVAGVFIIGITLGFLGLI